MFAVKHLQDIYTSKVTLRQNCNAGYKLVNKKGSCLGFEFWASPDGIANLLSLTQLEETGHLVQYKTGGKMEVWTPSNKIIMFAKSTGVCRGMHYIDLSKPHDSIRDVTSKDSFTFVETVCGRMEGFTVEQVQRAADARDGLAMMGHPPQDKISRLVSNKSSIIQNMPFTAKDLSNSTALFGPDRGAMIRGKTIRSELIQILRDLFDRLQHVVIDCSRCDVSQWIAILRDKIERDKVAHRRISP
ncbi:hypothetical protein ACHAXN_006788 [Cyclotella atomus]